MAPKKLDKQVVRSGEKKKAGRNPCPLGCLDGRNGLCKLR
jgi:hypothetical protein